MLPPPLFLKNRLFPHDFRKDLYRLFFNVYPESFPRLDGEKNGRFQTFSPSFSAIPLILPPFFPLFSPLVISNSKAWWGKNSRFQIFPPYFPLFYPFFPLCFLHFSPLAIFKAWWGKKMADSKFFPPYLTWTETFWGKFFPLSSFFPPFLFFFFSSFSPSFFFFFLHFFSPWPFFPFPPPTGGGSLGRCPPLYYYASKIWKDAQQNELRMRRVWVFFWGVEGGYGWLFSGFKQ